jgi:hypothetical protein
MIISFVMNMAISWLTMGFYMMPQYWPVWSKVMMPEAGPPPTSFYIWALIFDFITGLVNFITYTSSFFTFRTD